MFHLVTNCNWDTSIIPVIFTVIFMKPFTWAFSHFSIWPYTGSWHKH